VIDDVDCGNIAIVETEVPKYKIPWDHIKGDLTIIDDIDCGNIAINESVVDSYGIPEPDIVKPYEPAEQDDRPVILRVEIPDNDPFKLPREEDPLEEEEEPIEEEIPPIVEEIPEEEPPEESGESKSR
jgi:hypothetical protein